MYHESYSIESVYPPTDDDRVSSFFPFLLTPLPLFGWMVVQVTSFPGMFSTITTMDPRVLDHNTT